MYIPLRVILPIFCVAIVVLYIKKWVADAIQARADRAMLYRSYVQANRNRTDIERSIWSDPAEQDLRYRLCLNAEEGALHLYLIHSPPRYWEASREALEELRLKNDLLTEL